MTIHIQVVSICQDIVLLGYLALKVQIKSLVTYIFEWPNLEQSRYSVYLLVREFICMLCERSAVRACAWLTDSLPQTEAKEP